MALQRPPPSDASHDRQQESDFFDQLSASLDGADRARRRRQWTLRVRRPLPLILLVGPVLGWRLLQVSPESGHLAIASLAWLAFLLDVAVHMDTLLLSYLGLGWLPTTVGVLLFLLVAVTILTGDDR